MPLNRVNLVALVAILATSAISSNMSVLLPITRVLAQTTPFSPKDYRLGRGGEGERGRGGEEIPSVILHREGSNTSLNDAQLVLAAKQAQLENNPLKAEADKLIEQGNKQFKTSQFRAALGSYEQALKIYQSIKDQKGEESALNGVGLAYSNLGDYNKAIDYQSQSLAIARAIGDRLGESKSLGNLGIAYYSLGDYNKAIDYHSQTLVIKRAIGDRLGESHSLNNLGVTHLHSGNPKAAEENLRRAISVDESIRKDLQNNDAFKISIFETQASSYLLLQQALVAQNHTLDALLIAERGRTQALIELVASRLGLSSKPVTLNLEQIQHIAQQQNATLVEYSITSNDLYIWVIKPTGEVAFRKVDLKKTEIGNLSENARVAAATIAEGRGVANQIITGLVSTLLY